MTLFKLRIVLSSCFLYSTRQLSEENANLQVYVEKESSEKKRLSRTNEELLWRLQTGELSPRMSPTQSPLHRPASSPASPSRQQPFPRWVSNSLPFLLRFSHSFFTVTHVSHFWFWLDGTEDALTPLTPWMVVITLSVSSCRCQC